jgi:hypothetical protein
MAPASECCKTEIAPENNTPMNTRPLTTASGPRKSVSPDFIQFKTISTVEKGRLVRNDNFVLEFEALTPSSMEKKLWFFPKAKR